MEIFTSSPHVSEVSVEVHTGTVEGHGSSVFPPEAILRDEKRNCSVEI